MKWTSSWVTYWVWDMDEKMVNLRLPAPASVDALIHFSNAWLITVPLTSNPHNQHLKTSHRIIKTKTGFRDFERLYGPVLKGKAAWVRLSSSLSICILKKSSATKQIGTFKDLNLTVYLNCAFSSSEQWRFNSVTAHGLSSTRILFSD